VPVFPSEITHFVARMYIEHWDYHSYELGIADRRYCFIWFAAPALMPHVFVRDMNFGKYEESSAGRYVALFCVNRYRYWGHWYRYSGKKIL